MITIAILIHCVKQFDLHLLLLDINIIAYNNIIQSGIGYVSLSR